MPCPKKRDAPPEIDAGPSAATIVERTAIPPTHEFYGLEPCQHGTKEVDKTLPGCKPRPGKDCVQRYVEWKCNLGPNDDCMRPKKKTVCKRKDEVEERAFVPLGPGRSIRRSAVAERNQREAMLNEPGNSTFSRLFDYLSSRMVGADRLRIGLKEGDLPESAKRDVPAAVEYYSASTSTSTPSSDITLNYLKCKDFCKFDESSPPTCLPNCYLIDGQIQLDAPLLLVPPPATVTTSEASIDTSMTTLQTSTTTAAPSNPLLASSDHIEERAPPDIGEKSLDKREDVPGRFSTATFASPFIPKNLCIVHLQRLSPAELADTIIPKVAIPKALTDRTNTPAINTAAFRKLDGNILAAVTVEAAKKVGNKAAGHNGKRTESDQAPKVSALEDLSGEDEDKKDKRAIHERGLDVSQNLPQGHPLHNLYGGDRVDNYNGKRAEERGFDHMPNGHPKEDIFDKEKKDRRGDGLDTSR
ncbi:MAG: hypothetical protein Q9204_007214, partial [Flavoplaca sp. TL-2023a]